MSESGLLPVEPNHIVAILSLKRFLDVDEAELALRKVVSLFLESIGAAAVDCNRVEREAFAEEMKQLQLRTAEDPSPDTLFVTSGAAAQAMTDYNRRVSAFLSKQNEEIKGIAAAVAETALRLGGGNAEAAQRLQEIGNRFEAAGEMHDLHSLKTHLRECLQSFREETQRQRAESDATIQALQREIERRPACNLSGEMADTDPVTGLPRQTTGTREMQEAAKSGKHTYVLVMVVKGVQSINARFGFDVGDRMLYLFAQHVDRHIMHSDKLFRWDGPAVVALLDRNETMEQVRAQVRRMLDEPLEGTFSGNGRAVMIPISAAWSVLRLTPPVALTIKQIQMFIASQRSPAASV